LHFSRLIEVVTRLAPGTSEGPDLVLLATHSPALVQKAAQALPGEMGAISLWRGREGQVLATEWAGSKLADAREFELFQGEAFEGR
jgi:hypothetical protein